jgi:hypothetical protein
MSDSSESPPKVGPFVRFLNGESVSEYGGAGDGGIVSEALEKALPSTIYSALRRPEFKDNASMFLERTLLSFSGDLYFTLRSWPKPIDETALQAINRFCRNWAFQFGTALLHSEDASTSASSFQLPELVKALHQNISDRGGIPPEDDSATNQLVSSLSEELLRCMRKYLDDRQNSEERAARAKSSRSLTSSNQEGLDVGVIESGYWQSAWKTPFLGRSLSALETKLQLNADAIRTADDRSKKQMSRIIPVVQASGTGKSRLSEEYGFVHFEVDNV